MRRLVATLLVAAFGWAFSPCPTVAQTLPEYGLSGFELSEFNADSSSTPTPKGALWRSLVVPGWGQVYVGQPVKAPFVVGALGGLAGLSIYLNGRYRRYQHAYLYVVSETVPDPTTPNPDNPYASYFQDWVDSGALSATNTRQLRDDGRRNRDLAILGTGLIYALQALDAYVAAHLIDFDVSEDLSLHVLPSSNGTQLVAVIQL